MGTACKLLESEHMTTAKVRQSEFHTALALEFVIKYKMECADMYVSNGHNLVKLIDECGRNKIQMPKLARVTAYVCQTWVVKSRYYPTTNISTEDVKRVLEDVTTCVNILIQEELLECCEEIRKLVEVTDYDLDDWEIYSRYWHLLS